MDKRLLYRHHGLMANKECQSSCELPCRRRDMAWLVVMVVRTVIGSPHILVEDVGAAHACSAETACIVDKA